MSDMRGLTIIIASADASRLHAALSLASAQAALDWPARIYFHAGAVSLLKQPITSPEDEKFDRAGLPKLQELMIEADALGVRLLVCQSGLDLAGMTATDLPKGCEVGGLVGLLTTLGEDRLLFV